MKEIILKTYKEIIYLVSSVIIMLFSFLALDNIYMYFISLLLLSLCLVKFIDNFFNISIEILKGKKKYFWIYLIIRSLRTPIKFLIIISTIIYEYEILENKILSLNNYLENVYDLYSYSIIFLMGWTFLRFSSRLKEFILKELNIEALSIKDDEDKKIHIKYKATSIHAAFKIINITIILISTLIFFQKIGFALSGLLAFGGMSGIIVGFASKDLLANFFGGIMVYFNRPFDIGDWVRSPDREIEGNVDEIGWLLTKIITFDKRPIYIPNAAFTTISVENPSRMTHRRIKEYINLDSENSGKISNLTKDIKSMICEHNGIDENQLVIVSVDSVVNHNLKLFIYCFTKTIVWENYHAIKQDIILKTLKICEENECSLGKNEIRIQNFEK